jgi:hypothetical protein
MKGRLSSGSMRDDEEWSAVQDVCVVVGSQGRLNQKPTLKEILQLFWTSQSVLEYTLWQICSIYLSKSRGYQYGCSSISNAYHIPYSISREE